MIARLQMPLLYAVCLLRGHDTSSWKIAVDQTRIVRVIQAPCCHRCGREVRS